jgi:hypothetical protein
MTVHGAIKMANKKKLVADPSAIIPGIFDPCFMSSLSPGLPIIAEKGIKIAVNAGASDAQLLAKEVAAEVKKAGLNLKVAWIEGDDIVICGRVADAAPTIEAAAWWHDWDSENFNALAGSLMAGHLIECSAYVSVDTTLDSRICSKAARTLGSPSSLSRRMVTPPLPKKKERAGRYQLGLFLLNCSTKSKVPCTTVQT